MKEAEDTAMDEQERIHEQTRRIGEQVGEQVRRLNEQVGEQTRRLSEQMRKESQTFTRIAGAGVEAIGVWTEIHQRVLREMSDLGMRMVRESAALSADIGRSMIDLYCEGQTAALRLQTTWPEALTDPVAWYQRALTSTVDTTQKAFRAMDGGAQVVTESVHRLQSSADQAGRGIQEAFKSATSRSRAA